ncbi:hypothetical protein GN958_ATG10585 [Phytophthora infestans]|uniref:Uncharacterized protein n=1 Tax=Phytophthora infestans TaxID=4787 RepID=A0A8S9UI87_PHYIN|nr:hypothetical protein GN958_ATG10585 [Phytophthora infestans]
MREARPNVDSETTLSTSDTRGPQGDARQARRCLAGWKRRRRTAIRRMRGSNRVGEEVPQAASQQSLKKTVDVDGELHQGVKV